MTPVRLLVPIIHLAAILTMSATAAYVFSTSFVFERWLADLLQSTLEWEKAAGARVLFGGFVFGGGAALISGAPSRTFRPAFSPLPPPPCLRAELAAVAGICGIRCGGGPLGKPGRSSRHSLDGKLPIYQDGAVACQRGARLTATKGQGERCSGRIHVFFRSPYSEHRNCRWSRPESGLCPEVRAGAPGRCVWKGPL